jgi:DNA-binding HxlR family transcriptional regulator
MGAEPARDRSDNEAAHGPGDEDEVPGVPPSRSGPNPVELDRLIHGRVRLGIVSALAVHEVLSFPELKELLETSDGNLSVHARRLEEGGYLSCSKSFEGRIPRTEYRLTEAGRKALARYLDHMEALIDRVREP